MATGRGNDEEPSRVERARLAKDSVAARLRRLPNVVGSGVGYKIVRGKSTRTIAVRVYVSEKVSIDELRESDVVPESIDGIPTDVIEATFHLHQTGPGSEHRRWRANLLGGISIGNVLTGGSGTLGAGVFDAATGHQLLLTNWHVICGRVDCAPGERIIQPGTGGGDVGRAGDVVAELLRASLTDVVDGAVARVTGHRLLFDEILGIGRPAGTAQAILGEVARKSGRTTNVTAAEVADVDADVEVDYSDFGMGVRTLRHQIVLEGDHASEPGDSGSVWVNASNQVIGLNFAGSTGRGIANPIVAVVEELGIVIGRGVPLHDHLVLA